MVASGTHTTPTTPVRTTELALRGTLRGQIARLEWEIGWLGASGCTSSMGAVPAPRLLDAAALEALRDRLAGRLQALQRALGVRSLAQQRRRELLEAMVEDPAHHRWMRVSNEQIGEPGCKRWVARPKLGLIGMLMGWWRVKVSSGCP